MRYFSTFATAAVALFSVASAGDAPAASDDNSGITYSATLPGAHNITGAVIGSAAPNGKGTNLQVAFYDLPGGNITYAIHSGRVSKNDCSGAGGVLDPFGGVSGSACNKNNMQACQIGDLSDKHGAAYTQSGGAGTGYFAANYIDAYLSTDSSSKSFFGKGSLVVMSAEGTTLTCANFEDASKSKTSTSTATGSSTATGTASVTSNVADSASKTASSSASSASASNAADRNVVVGMGAVAFGLLGLVI